MSYTRVKTANFGSTSTGLDTVAYSLDGGSTWTTTGITEVAAGTGIYKATVTFADGFRGVLLWRTVDTAGKYAAEDINPETEEIPSQVWANGNRTVTAFSFAVTVGGFSATGPTFRSQDDIVSPTWEDCLASSWAAANGKESESDTAKTWVRYGPDGATPIRSFSLTTDNKGNPVGRS